MERSKLKGNLRDFRIDGQMAQKPAQAASQQSPARKMPQAAAPTSKVIVSQSIKSRMAPQIQQPKAPAQIAPKSPLDLVAPVPAQSSLLQRAQPEVIEQKPAASTPSWGLSDFSMPSAEDVNLWGEWQQELSPQVDLRKEILAQAPTATPSYSEKSTPSNLSETQSDKTLEMQNEWKRLNTESQGKLPWVTELALAERQAERLGVVDFASGLQKHEVLKMRTHEYLLKITTAFREQVELFNESRRSPAHVIQIYKINNTQDDFMLFRNGVKLVVSGSQAGRILFGFNQFMGQAFQGATLPTTEVSAVWGPFEQLVWMYKGERVIVDDMVRYFLSEFVRQSFR